MNLRLMCSLVGSLLGPTGQSHRPPLTEATVFISAARGLFVVVTAISRARYQAATLIAPRAVARFTADSTASSDAVMMLWWIPTPNNVTRECVVIST